MLLLFLPLFVALLAQAKDGGATKLLNIPIGSYKALLGKGELTKVASFQVDETPVTNEQFYHFVNANPEWKKSNAPALFVDEQYLMHWKKGRPKKESLKSPVVYISWFAANAYCEWRERRLPTVDEWEYLAQFGPRDKTADIKSIILEWYSKPNPRILPNVKSTFANKFGVWDVHGLVWEWSQDFNSTFVTGESRGDTSLEKNMFCGAGAIGIADTSDYPAFLRFGFRSSLKGNYTVANLGFRCAKDLHE